MHIVVCVKQTPSTANMLVDFSTGKIKTEGLQYEINPFDEYAVEEALRIKERLPNSTVSVLSLGPDRAEEVIRYALALGCDAGFLVAVDPAMHVFEPTTTSYLLSLALKKIVETKGPVHLVLCGKQSSDQSGGQVALSLGAWLDWLAVSFVKKIPQIDESKVSVERMMEDGLDALELPLPAVVSVLKEINEPRLPSLKGKMASKKAQIAKWTTAELNAAPGAAPTAEVKTFPPPARAAGMKVPGETPEEKAAFVVQKFKEMKVL